MSKNKCDDTKNNANYITLATEQNLPQITNTHFFTQSSNSKNITKVNFIINGLTTSNNNTKLNTTGNNYFLLQNKPFISRRDNKKNHVIKLKNNMLFNWYKPGCSPYDPYLIKVCKNAIIKEKKQLPNYKKIIDKINTEFGIEDDDTHTKYAKNNKFKKAFNTFVDFSNNNFKKRNNFSLDEKKIKSDATDVNNLKNTQL
jgi:hypothetical protein